jgi:hypothetical protein
MTFLAPVAKYLVSRRLFWLTAVSLFILSGCQQDPAPSPPENTPFVQPTAMQPAAMQPTAVATITPTTAPTVPAPPAPTAPPAIVPETVAPPPTPAAVAKADGSELPGALIQIDMQSQVGVLLDELPPEMRERVAADLLAQPPAAWEARALRQLRLTRNRLTFRDFVYDDKGQLPLPPPELWQIELDSAGPSRQTIQGHDLVLIGYSFSSTLLTGAEAPALAEPALAAAGGVWIEPFIFPADPDLLLQRAGNACVNEAGFPPGSYDSENIWHFYNFDCTADSSGAAGCHRTTVPTLSCREALQAAVGEVETSIRFERLPWDEALADEVRLGEVSSWETPDLTAVTADLSTNRIIYKYIEADDCALEEGSVGGAGWRRLLQFDATVWNVGARPLHIGKANVEDNDNNVFTYSPCHDHFHYTNYGDFYLQNQAGLTGSKQAFCVQSTNRMSNNETSPLTHNYSCSFQGVQAGWADEYIAGLDSQWVDITDLQPPPEGTIVRLGFTSNGDRFLCEGDLLVDENGVQLWEPSGFTTADGDSINRTQCDFIPGWEDNNQASAAVFVPQTGSFVTEPCANGELGPRRNCGFTELELSANERFCEPGEAVALTVPLPPEAEPLVLRVCEWSGALGAGVACTFENALQNQTITGETAVTFPCPPIRDAGTGATVTGGYALYATNLFKEP